MDWRWMNPNKWIISNLVVSQKFKQENYRASAKFDEWKWQEV